jgi:hypothetical protein
VRANGLVASPVLFGPKPWHWIVSWGSHVLVRLGVYGALLAIAGSFRLPRQVAVIAGLVLDLSLYQLAVYQTRVPKMRDAALLPAAAARAVSNQAERSDAPTNPESRRALELASKTGSRELYWYVYQFAHLDPCRGKWRTDYYQAGVDRLLGFDRVSGGNQDALLGCGVPKLRVATDVRIASSPEDARARLRDATAAGDQLPTVIHLVAGSDAPRAEHAEGAVGDVIVERFTLGELVVTVDVATADGAWLVYDDAYHPGRRAEVNGLETPVQVANLAWKAVRIPHGRSTVRFWFRHGANHVLGTSIALFGLVSGAGLIAWMLACTLLGARGQDTSCRRSLSAGPRAPQ